MKVEHEIVINIKPRWFRRQLGIRFDMLCFFRLLEEFGISLGDDVGEIAKVPFDELIATAIYTGAESYCFHNRQKFELDKAQVLKWVDDSVITHGQMKQIGKMWLEFMQTWETDKKKAAKEAKR